MSIRQKWIKLYAGMALFTLAFQVWVRSLQCNGFADLRIELWKSGRLGSNLANLLDGVLGRIAAIHHRPIRPCGCNNDI
jgi:hypothetical protein